MVPFDPEGSKRDIEQSIDVGSIEDAEYLFVDIKDKLLDVNNWNKYATGMATAFRLTDSHGIGVGRHARKGDLIRISEEQPIGFEWGCIEAIEYDDYPDESMETFALRARNVPDPSTRTGHAKESEGSEATFTIVIERRKAMLFISWHGRSAKETTDGKWLDLPDKEWSDLVNGLLG